MQPTITIDYIECSRAKKAEMTAFRMEADQRSAIRRNAVTAFVRLRRYAGRGAPLNHGVEGGGEIAERRQVIEHVGKQHRPDDFQRRADALDALGAVAAVRPCDL